MASARRMCRCTSRSWTPVPARAAKSRASPASDRTTSAWARTMARANMPSPTAPRSASRWRCCRASSASSRQPSMAGGLLLDPQLLGAHAVVVDQVFDAGAGQLGEWLRGADLGERPDTFVAVQDLRIHLIELVVGIGAFVERLVALR